MTKVCIFGAGAVGGYLAAMIASKNAADVSVIARGPHLVAIKQNGLTVDLPGAVIKARPPACDDARQFGHQDYVIVTLKAHAIPAALDAIRPLLGPDTAIVFAQNGIPWWYFFRVEGPLRDTRINAVDPGGRIWNALDPARAIGCVVYAASEVTAPGIIKYIEGDRFTLGEPSGEQSKRVQTLSEIFTSAGLKAPVRPAIRDEIWLKLWGNCAFNPLSILTHATLEDMCKDEGVCGFARKVMIEVQAVATALGVTFPVTLDRRLEAAQAVGAHKTSMLQDLERGRPMEIDALVTAVQEIARLVDTPTPNLDTLLALARQRARAARTYPSSP